MFVSGVLRIPTRSARLYVSACYIVVVIGIDTIYLLCKHCLSSKAEREEISMKGSRTNNATSIQEGTLIVAIDIGMISNHGYCAAADGRKKLISNYLGVTAPCPNQVRILTELNQNGCPK